MGAKKKVKPQIEAFEGFMAWTRESGFLMKGFGFTKTHAMGALGYIGSRLKPKYVRVYVEVVPKPLPAPPRRRAVGR